MSDFSIIKIDPDTWAKDFSEAAHLACFKESSNPYDEHIDFAFIAIYQGKASAYLTARHIGSGGLYLAYGGAFSPILGTTRSLPIYLEMIKECLSVSNYLMTYVDNKNITYLKMAYKAGFLATGFRTFKEHKLFELTLEKEP